MSSVINRQIEWTHKDGRTEKYPIIEATTPHRFEVEKGDIMKAKSLNGYEDPNCCVAACAIRREHSDGIFQRDTAYILRVIGGKIYAVRYRFGSSLRKAIHTFDSEGTFPAGEYKLLAPSVSQTLEAKTKRKTKIPLTKRKVRSHVKFTTRGKVKPLS